MTPTPKEHEVLFVQPGSWLTVYDKDGNEDGYDITEGRKVVWYRDYLKVVAERDAAVRELQEARKREALSDAIVDECDSDITKLVQERATLRARLAACERVVEAACEWEKRYGWQHDVAYSFAQKELAAAVDSYRAAVAAETKTTTHTENQHV